MLILSKIQLPLSFVNSTPIRQQLLISTTRIKQLIETKRNKTTTNKMPVEFYYIPESPPCRTVEMVAHMAGVELSKNYVDLFKKEQLNENFSTLNPLKKVPFIIDGGVRLNESRAISAYLVNKYLPDNNTLYPREPEQRAKIDELLYLDMGTLDGMARKLLVPRLLNKNLEHYDPEAEKAFKVSLEYFNNRLMNRKTKFALGDNITIADISIASSLSFIDCFEYDISEYKALKSYQDLLKASITNYSQVSDKAVEKLKAFIKDKSTTFK